MGILLESVFQEMDANSDGEVSKAEWDAFMEAQQEKKGKSFQGWFDALESIIKASMSKPPSVEELVAGDAPTNDSKGSGKGSKGDRKAGHAATPAAKKCP